MALASPLARLVVSSIAASDSRMVFCFMPSARLMAACRSPSESSTCARLRRSASACISIAALMERGGAMSLISYRRHCRPHAEEASLMTRTMDAFSCSRSSKVLSSEILPSSLRGGATRRGTTRHGCVSEARA
jgi:hypothetical protein